MRMQLQATNSELYSASKRLLEERQPLEGFSNDITGTSYRADQRCEARRIDLLAQAPDVDIDQGGDGGQAVEFRQHTVEGDQIVITTHGADQAFATVVHPIYIQSMATQLGDDLAGRYGVILDGQNTGHRITW